jgi:head-tail adaptor
MADLDPGQLTQRVRFEQQPLSADSFTARSWTLLAAVWASVKPTRSVEIMRADAMQAVLTHTVMVRWSRALAVPQTSAEWRIVYVDRLSGDQHVLAIVGPGRNIGGQGRWMIFDCVEGLSDGH